MATASSLGAFSSNGSLAAAFRVSLQAPGELSIENGRASLIPGTNVLDTFEPKGMIEQGGGHRSIPEKWVRVAKDLTSPVDNGRLALVFAAFCIWALSLPLYIPNVVIK